MNELEQYVPLAAGFFTVPAYGRYRAVHGPEGWAIRPADEHDRDAPVLDSSMIVHGVYVTAARFNQQAPLPAAAAVLDTPIGANDAGAATIGGFLIELLRVAMSMKRPFGFSGWRYELYRSLARAGLIPARFDLDGTVDLASIDRDRADAILEAAVSALRGPTAGTGQSVGGAG